MTHRQGSETGASDRRAATNQSAAHPLVIGSIDLIHRDRVRGDSQLIVADTDDVPPRHGPSPYARSPAVLAPCQVDRRSRPWRAEQMICVRDARGRQSPSPAGSAGLPVGIEDGGTQGCLRRAERRQDGRHHPIVHGDEGEREMFHADVAVVPRLRLAQGPRRAVASRLLVLSECDI